MQAQGIQPSHGLALRAADGTMFGLQIETTPTGTAQDPLSKALQSLQTSLPAMSRRCQVTGAGTRAGRSIARRGLPKKKGGVGLKTTGVSKRTFKVNIQKKRIWVPELGEYVRVKLSTRALKTISKKGAYRVLVDAGVIKPIRPQRQTA